MTTKRVLVLVAACSALCGAARAADTVAFAPAQPQADQPRGAWWRVWRDPTLDGLEARLETASPDLALAVARHDLARSYLAGVSADRAPQLGLAGSATANRQSNDRPLRGANQPDLYAADALGLVFSYEIDLFGRVRAEIAAGKAEEKASAEDLQSVRLSLQAETAVTYLRLRRAEAELDLLRRSLAAYQRIEDLVARRRDGGVASGFDLERSKVQVQSTRALVEEAAARRALYEHALAALVGERADAFHIAPDPGALQPFDAPASVTSDLVQRRPDIAAAADRLAAANARVGLARKAFFPVLSLSGALGFQNTGRTDLLSYADRFWTIGPAAALTLFDGGRRKAGVEAARAERDARLALYKRTVLGAFQEVEDNLSLLSELKAEETDEDAAVVSARRAEAISLARYNKGAVTYLETALAQSSALEAERKAVTVREARLEAGVRLVEALGGGWTPNPAATAGGR